MRLRQALAGAKRLADAIVRACTLRESNRR